MTVKATCGESGREAEAEAPACRLTLNAEELRVFMDERKDGESGHETSLQLFGFFCSPHLESPT